MTNRHHPAAAIDWQRLLAEFARYRTGTDLSRHDPLVFMRSLAEPLPAFAATFLRLRARSGSTWAVAVRDLYGYLLEKRQEERLNLLHFAFDIFDDSGCLPDEILAQTPLPHEDGLPSYRHRLDPSFILAIPPVD